MGLKHIKNKIKSVDKTHKVTKAMEAVSAVKMRKSQERALEGRAYAYSALAILQRVSGSLDRLQHPLAKRRDIKNVYIIVVTSDKGLAGSLSIAVLKKVTHLIEEKGWTKEQLGLVCIGKKATAYFKRREYTILESHSNISDALKHEDLTGITEHALQLYAREKYDRCYIAYTNFKSTFEQEPVIRRLLPISIAALTETVEAIRPTRGKYSERNDHKDFNINEYTIEPSAEEVLGELLSTLLNIEIYHALLEAKASEHSARMVAMKNASDKAEEISKELNLKFNKERQALITREVSEIIGGIESMKV